MRSALLAAVLLVAGCGGGEKASAPLPTPQARLSLSSPAFPDQGTLPAKYTCTGAGVSPPLAWADVPHDARELTLVVEDPDAGRFVHWTVLEIDPGSTGVAEGAVPKGGVQTTNSFGNREWGSACPPKGDRPHRYVFALYASREPLGLGEDARPDEVRAALARRATARGVLSAHFGR